MLATIVLAVLVVYGSGCGYLHKDPRTSFEVFMRSYLNNYQIVMDEIYKSSTIRNEIIQPATRYDVQKTASLVTPYEGSLTYTLKAQLFHDGEWGTPVEYTETLKFGYRDGKWTPPVAVDLVGNSFLVLSDKSWITNVILKAYERTPQ